MPRLLAAALLSTLLGCTAAVDALVPPPPEPPAPVPPLPVPPPPYVGPVQGAVAIASGYGLRCVIGEDTRVLCWGGYIASFGSAPHALGVIAAPVPGLIGARALAISDDHGCALLDGGSIACWGFNHYFQLGTELDPEEFHSVATTVPGIDDAIAIGVGSLHNCALRQDETVWCWGWGDFDQLGTQIEGGSAVPLQVPGLEHVQQISAGGWETCALTADGRAWCWGYNPFGNLGNGDRGDRFGPSPVVGLSDVTAIAALGDVTYALTRSGDLYGFGALTVDLMASPTPVFFRNIPGAVEFASSYSHSCARRTDGAVLCWGKNDAGQLGLGEASNGDASDPTPVVGLGAATQLAVGGKSSCALGQDRRVQCWGLNDQGLLGYGRAAEKTASTALVAFEGARSIATAYARSCAILTDGTVRCAGRNLYGELGDETTANRAESAPVTATREIRALALGFDFSCALDSTAQVRCFGAGKYGQLGDGNQRESGVSNPAVRLGSVTAIAAGQQHACAIDSDGAVWCWGRNDAAQLGDGTQNDSPLPVRVGTLRGVTALSLGAEHSCALALGTVWCWGQNHEGQLGNPPDFSTPPKDWRTLHLQLEPKPIAGISNAIGLSAAARHSCVLLEGGETRCFGQPYQEWTGVSAPVPPLVALLGSQGGSSCGRGEDGSIHCWDAQEELPALPFDDLIDVESAEHSCALLRSGEVRCFGQGSVGALADGDAFRAAPTQVVIPAE